jgi:hypothetical protein
MFLILGGGLGVPFILAKSLEHRLRAEGALEKTKKLSKLA